MHRHIYRKKIFSALLILLFCFGFPTMITLVFGSKSGFRPGTSFVSSGRSIVLTTENTKETYDIEEFLPCLLMGQASIDDNEAFLEAFAIVLRTYVCQRLSGPSNFPTLAFLIFRIPICSQTGAETFRPILIN